MPRARYDDIADRYDAAMRPLERWFLTRWRAETLSKLPVGGRILEVGAGTGLNFRFYPSDSFGAATELSREMLKIAAAKERPEEVRLVQSAVETIAFASDVFDAAFATFVFCSIKSPAIGFSELRRVVKAGGRIVMLDHVRPRGVLGPFFDLLNFITVPCFEDHVNRHPEKEAETAGLRIISREEKALGLFNVLVCEVS